MVKPELFRTYKQFRQKGNPPHIFRETQRIDREIKEFVEKTNLKLSQKGENIIGDFLYEKYRINVLINPDLFDEYDIYGKFTDQWCEGAIQNGHPAHRSKNEYKWFVPETSIKELRHYFSSIGYSKNDAEVIARKSVKETLDRAKNIGINLWTVRLSACLLNVELSDQNLYGIEVDEKNDFIPYIMEMLPELIKNAKETLQSLVAAFNEK